jgi:hypothetical protein
MTIINVEGIHVSVKGGQTAEERHLFDKSRLN